MRTVEDLERCAKESAEFERALIEIAIALGIYHSLEEWYACGDDLI